MRAHDCIVSLTAVEREQRLLELRLAGHTWQQISDALKYGGAGHALNAYRRTIARAVGPQVAELRNQQWERLEAIHQAWWGRRGDSVGAATLMRVYERGAKLWGLDAPVKTELTGADGGPVEVSNVGELLLERLSRLSQLPIVVDSGESGAADRSIDAGGADAAPLLLAGVGEGESEEP